MSFTLLLSADSSPGVTSTSRSGTYLPATHVQQSYGHLSGGKDRQSMSCSKGVLF